MDTNVVKVSPQGPRAEKVILRHKDMMRIVAEVMLTFILEDESRELDTVMIRNDEKIRFPLHFLDGNMLKDKMKAR